MAWLKLFAVVVGYWPVALLAENAGASTRAASRVISYTDILQWAAALLLVLFMFGALVWLLRKTGTLPSPHKAELAIVAGLSMGVREKLVLVKVGEKQLLLGVTSSRIDKLLELDGEQRLFQNQSDEIDAALFAQKLKQVLQGNHHG